MGEGVNQERYLWQRTKRNHQEERKGTEQGSEHMKYDCQGFWEPR